jgi:hypothetical protein
LFGRPGFEGFLIVAVQLYDDGLQRPPRPPIDLANDTGTRRSDKDPRALAVDEERLSKSDSVALLDAKARITDGVVIAQQGDRTNISSARDDLLGLTRNRDIEPLDDSDGSDAAALGTLTFQICNRMGG